MKVSYLLAFAAIGLLLPSCKPRNTQIKEFTVAEYEAVKEKGKFSKGDLLTKQTIAYYKNGTQKYLVSYLLNPNSGDTTNFAPSEPLASEVKGNKTLFFNNNNQLVYLRVENGDTTLFYMADNLDTPEHFEIHKGKRLIAEEYPQDGIKRTFLKPKYNQYGECEYALVKELDEGLGYEQVIIYEASYTYY